MMAALPGMSFKAQAIAELRAKHGEIGGFWQNGTFVLHHASGARSDCPRVRSTGYCAIDDTMLSAYYSQRAQRVVTIFARHMSRS